MVDTYDVIIVGAGAAGMACAEKLLEVKKKILVLEARNHIGGRAYTKLTTSLPVEMGAEFIHGNPKNTMAYLKTFDVHFYDVTDKHILYKDGKIKQTDQFWKTLEHYTNKISKTKKTDRSLQDFIDSGRFPKNFSLKMFQSFVEGFHAADLNKMGEKGFLSAEEIRQDDDINGTDQFRLTDGYSNLWQKLVLSQKNFLDQIKFDTVVKEIDYTRKKVTVKTNANLAGDQKNYLADHVVVTVPIGVLKSEPDTQAYIHWTPAPPKELDNALKAIEMGHIQKLVFQFRSRFWEDLQKEKITFFHTTPDVYFPTWWTYLPLRVPYLTAWQGGPKAQEMSQWSENQIRWKALNTLSKLTKKPISFLEDELLACYHHNWSNDPFALGAYSYVLTDGLKKAKDFSKPTTRQIVFAGEATMADATRATVHGALESGARAAEYILSL